MRSILTAIAAAFAIVAVSRRKRVYVRYLASLLRRPIAGALVSRISAGSPAEKAGMRIGDVIIRFAGNKIRNRGELTTLVAAATPGDDAKVDVMRKGRRKTFTLTIAGPERPCVPAGQPSREND